MAAMSNTGLSKVKKQERILKPWMTPEIISCIRHRNKLHKKVRQSPDNEDVKTNFTSYRTYCNNLIKKAKRAYLLQNEGENNKDKQSVEIEEKNLSQNEKENNKDKKTIEIKEKNLLQDEEENNDTQRLEIIEKNLFQNEEENNKDKKSIEIAEKNLFQNEIKNKDKEA